MKSAKRISSKRLHGRKGISTWLSIVMHACDSQPISLRKIYAQVKTQPKARGRKHVEAKVRQVLYTHPEMFIEVRAGVWSLVEYYAPDEVKRLRIEREKRLASRRPPTR